MALTGIEAGVSQSPCSACLSTPLRPLAVLGSVRAGSGIAAIILSLPKPRREVAFSNFRFDFDFDFDFPFHVSGFSLIFLFNCIGRVPIGYR